MSPTNQMNPNSNPEPAGSESGLPVCARPGLAPLCARVRSLLSPDRFAHVMRVTELAEAIARANDFTEQETETTVLAGLLHDSARELPTEELFRLAPPESQLELEHPLTVHGRAGRKMAELWGITDEAVLDAIEGHVFGVDLANRPGIAVYVADVTEPGRGVNDDIRELAMEDLEAAYIRAVQVTVDYLESIGVPVHPQTARIRGEISPAS